MNVLYVAIQQLNSYSMQEQRRLPYLKNRVQQTTFTEPTGGMGTNSGATNQPPITAATSNTPYNNTPQPSNTNTYSSQPPPPNLQNSNSQPPTPPINTNTTQQPRASTNRIDTEQIPRPIIKSEESINYSQFSSMPTPLYHPPASHNYFLTEDNGNSNPRYLRCSMYAIGNEPSITNQTEIPLGLIIQPLAETAVYEQPLPLVEFPGEPIRCQRCKAYVNPFLQFVESGNQYVCNICKMKNPVAPEYFSPLGVGNQRGDKYNRFELHRGAYEIVAPPEYVKKPIANILILFCIELTTLSVQKGVYLQIISSIQSIIDSIPAPDRTDIAFITFDQRMQMYNLPNNLSSEPQLIVISELDEVNIPLPIEKLFLNVQNDKDKIYYLIEKLTKMGSCYSESQQSKQQQQIPLGTVATNAAHLMAPRSGRILIFSHQSPSIGMGKYTARKQADPKVYGTDQEKILYQPQNSTFVDLGKFCLRNHISVDLWVFNDDHYDLATVAPLSNISGGSIYYYPLYDPIVNGSELHYALFRNLTRTYAYDCIMTVRASAGIVLFDYYTGAGRVSVRDLEVGTCDADQTIAVLFKQEDKINEPEAYVQYAMLYTNVYGQRLIRVLNLSLQVVNKSNGNNPWHNIFKTADVDAISLLFQRKNLSNIQNTTTKSVRQTIFEQGVNCLHAYRKYCSNTSPQGQLILPETIKTLPLFLQALNKRDILKQPPLKTDNKIFEQYLLMTQSCIYINNYLYPKLYPLHDINDKPILDQFYPGQYIEDQKTAMPSNIATTLDKIRSDGLYLLDTSQYIFLYVTRQLNPDILYDLFQVESVDQITNDVQLVTNPDSDFNQRINNIIEQIRRNKNGSYHPVKIIVQNTPAAAYLLTWLVEDEQKQEKSYGDYLCDIHAAIQAKGT